MPITLHLGTEQGWPEVQGYPLLLSSSSYLGSYLQSKPKPKQFNLCVGGAPSSDKVQAVLLAEVAFKLRPEGKHPQVWEPGLERANNSTGPEASVNLSCS